MRVMDKNIRERPVPNQSEAKGSFSKERAHAAEERLKYLFTSSPGIIYSCKPSGDYGGYLKIGITGLSKPMTGEASIFTPHP